MDQHRFRTKSRRLEADEGAGQSIVKIWKQKEVVDEIIFLSMGNVVFPQFVQTLQLFSLHHTVTILVALRVLQSEKVKYLLYCLVVDALENPFFRAALLEVFPQGLSCGFIGKSIEVLESECRISYKSVLIPWYTSRLASPLM